jgi:hypothetical protein
LSYNKKNNMKHPIDENREYFPSDDVLAVFFQALADDDIRALYNLHIPRSDVFYVREKYYNDTGHWVSLDRMEIAMFREGLLQAKDVQDPYRLRDWEKEDDGK